jgi:hypothetical protein
VLDYRDVLKLCAGLSPEDLTKAVEVLRAHILDQGSEQPNIAPEDWSKARRKLDVFDSGTRDGLRAMRWRSRWEVLPLEAMNIDLGPEGQLVITNSLSGHYHAKIIMNTRLEADFQTVVTLAGAYTDVQIQAANGEDRNFGCNPAAQGITVEAIHKIVVTRIGTRLEFSLLTEKGFRRLRYHPWQADAGMDCYVAIALSERETIELHSFTVET